MVEFANGKVTVTIFLHKNSEPTPKLTLQKIGQVVCHHPSLKEKRRVSPTTAPLIVKKADEYCRMTVDSSKVNHDLTVFKVLLPYTVSLLKQINIGLTPGMQLLIMQTCIHTHDLLVKITRISLLSSNKDKNICLHIYVYIYYLSSDLYEFLFSFVIIYSEETLHTILIHLIDIPILMYKVSKEY